MYQIIEVIHPDQLLIIRDLAYTIWPISYKEMLSSDQIEYMLGRFYNIDSLNSQIQHLGHDFFIVQVNDIPIGFLSLEYNFDGHNLSLKIQKLYVLPEMQGRGVGRYLINFAIDKAKQLHYKHIFLHVNRYNKAIYFYNKLNFVITKEEDFDIGAGYYMNDYLMKLDIE